MPTDQQASVMLAFHESVAAGCLRDAERASAAGEHTKVYAAWSEAERSADAAVLAYLRTDCSPATRVANRKAAVRTERLAAMTGMRAMLMRDRSWRPTPGVRPPRVRIFAGEVL